VSDNPQDIVSRITNNISRVLVGKEAAIELALVALGCEGHILVEDVPGVGKTMLARALAVSLGLSFSRIQCTPDLLPSDVTGMMVYNPKTCEFNLRPGPIMSNIVLVDEINRATPRTQSSLLEAMEERQVTIDIETRPLSRPFIVVATQNPVEFEGTFPLPEAQLDRFLIRIAMGYPPAEDELKILVRLEGEHPINSIKPVVTPEEAHQFIQVKQKIHMEDSLRAYVVELVSRTRSHPDLELGVSPRGTIALFNAARVLAAVRGQDYVIPEYIKYLAPFILAHRVIVSGEASVKGITGNRIIQEILNTVPVPTEKAFHE
jgi:MoxR-like ATPase